MTTEQRPLSRRRSIFFMIAAFLLGLVVMAGLLLLLFNIQDRKAEEAEYPLQVVEIPEGELDPAVWGLNFPRQYASFMQTEDDTISTPYGGSVPYSKLEKYPAMVRLWAGYAFAKDHNEERGHFYAQVDQAASRRVQIVSQPGACINCHAAESPQLIAEMGWEEFNSTPYLELEDQLHYGSSCADCHDPNTMELRITRPALLNALEVRGIDVETLTQQDMRTFVCAQCHVEYYFRGENKVLTFPWSQGLTIDDIEAHYDEYDFVDWTHAETNAPMLKMQHPEYELSSTGLHAQSGVSCADCHMPYIRSGAVKVSDHHLRSPLTMVNQSCQTCHSFSEQELTERIITIQNRTAELLRQSEEAILSAMDAIVEAQEAGADDAQLEEARRLHRRASMRWDFISSENSTGFHSPQESARVLADAIDFARQAEISARTIIVGDASAAQVDVD